MTRSLSLMTNRFPGPLFIQDNNSMRCSHHTTNVATMSDHPSRSERPSSSQRRSSVSSSRHESSSSRRNSVIESSSSRPSRSELSSTSKRRTSHTTISTTDMDEETRARLARREERRRRREREEGERRSRSSSIPRAPSPRPFGEAPKPHSQPPPAKPAYFSNVDFSAKEESEEKAFHEEAIDKFESLSAKKAAYLRAVEKREQRTSRSRSGDGLGGSAEHRRSYVDSKPATLTDKKSDDEIQSPSSKSGKHRSSRRQTEPALEKKERKSSRRSSVAITVERAEKKSGGEADLSKRSRSGDKARKREKRRSNDSSSSKEKKRSSKGHDETSSHRKKHSSRSKDDESGHSKERKRGKDDRSERRRSSRRSAELSERPPKDRSRAKSMDRLVSTSAHQREEFLKHRDERPVKEEDDAKVDEFLRRREERQAKREERRRLIGETTQSSGTRLRSTSVPRYTSNSHSNEAADPRRTIPSGPPEASSAALRKSIFGTMPTRDNSDTDEGLFGSNDAEAARNRLRERMAARERAKEASISDSEAASVSSRRSREIGVGDSALVSTRPKLVDVRRRGIASVLKQQRTNDVESRTIISSSSCTSESESESGEDSSSVEHIESESDDSSVGDQETWTVRVSLISAVDLPLHIVPNMPLCPVLKFGMVTFPADEADSGNGDTTEPKVSLEKRSSTLDQIKNLGLTSLSHSRVRCTSNKILSKRDNGAVEFHEEFRWDKVKRPMHTALVVELSAKASLPPTNLKESPLVTSTKCSASIAPRPTPSVPGESSNETQTKPGEDTSQRADIKRTQSGDSGIGGQGVSEETSNAATSVPSISRSGSTDGDNATPMVHGAGLTGMRALWKRGRQQFEQRQVARLSEPTESDSSKPSQTAADGGGGSEEQSSLGQGFLSRKTAPDRSLPSITDENVALLRPEKRRKLEMTEDLRLGSLVIPLTRLPLEKAIQNREVARIEQWYQLESYNVLVPSQTTPTWRGKSATKPLPRRSPTVQLEISFSPAEVVDDSEDDMDDISISELASLNDLAESEDRVSVLPSKGDKRPSLTDGVNAGTARSFARRAAGRSFQRRVASEMRTQDKKNEELTVAQSAPSQPVKKVPEDPVLEPGLVDFVCVVGVSNVGDQKDDDGGRGWVNSSPECSLLEQFPPNDEFHIKNGRNVALANKVEWFCFPEGWKIWRGEGPPSPADLNCIQRYSSSAAASTVQSTAAFDACLGCTTSFSWFVIASNSDEYGSKNVKTYGAVIKFYVPAPSGVDSTQDDYAQTMEGRHLKSPSDKKKSTAKRLWVPLGICLTSNLPIVGVMEAMLLRICETLASAESLSSQQKILPIIHKDIANLIVNFQKPISGVLHCSIPFLQGDRLHITLPPPTGLPPLPHGSSVSAVCHLLGAEGLNLMLSALLTECKIIVHSNEISNLAMVSEVTTALLYPFNWALPCIPVLPDAMLEFVEAPLSYLLGIPTSSLEQIDPSALEDVVVVDLDSDFGSSDYFDGRRNGKATKAPTPLPSSVATNIAKAVFRLLREEGEVAEAYGASAFTRSRSLPRLESESLAEREFRISVALQVCGLLRGYDDCLFKVSASQPVFNRDKFLKTAPALFETQRVAGPGNGRGATPRTLSPRSKRFLSILVNCQHFHQFLHSLDEDECAFFNEVMYTFDMNDEQEDGRMLGGYGTSPTDDAAAHLTKALQKVEDKIPTYRVERKGKKKERRASGGWDEDDELGFADHSGLTEKGQEKQMSDERFPRNLLQPIAMDPKLASSRPRASSKDGSSGEREISEGLHKMSVQLLMELEKGNWRYEKLFQILIEPEEGKEDNNEDSIVQVREKVRLREAIGERRYRTWKLKQEQKLAVHDSSTRLTSGDMLSAEANPALDLTSLLSSMADDATSETPSFTQSSLSVSTQRSARASTLSPEQQRLADAKDRDVLRRCLERAYEGSQKRPGRSNRRSSDEASDDSFFENGRDLVADAETALRNPSAQRFLVSVLSQRSRLENQKKRRSMIEDPKGARRQATQSSVSRLETVSFECLVRLCWAMLDSCMESKDYEPAYGLLTHTAGFCTIETKDGRGVDSRSDEASQDPSNKVIYMTARIGLHPIFADLRLWEEVLRLHLKDRENEKSAEPGPALIGKANSTLVEYEAAVATLYEMLGFGIPAEELARFATRVSEDRGWFDTERGHSLLILARRLGVRREQEGEAADGGLDLMRSPNGKHANSGATDGGATPLKSSTTTIGELEWSEIGWCHPAAPTTVRAQYVQIDGDERGGSSSKRLKRSAVTSIASFGSSVVASGGLDGSVFVAHTLKLEDDLDEEDGVNEVVHGIHLDWGSSGSRTAAVASSLSSMDGEYGVGAVSCLAAAKGAGYRSAALSASSTRNKDVKERADEEDFLSAMEGCRVVAGTTAGDLRVWTVKDVYAATVLAKKGSDKDSSSSPAMLRVTHGSGTTSSLVSKGRGRGITDIAAGSAFSRLQFSLRGRALSGHRGGVSSMDVPSHLYRPDSLVTGGADGFIKLWSLRPPMAGRRTSGETLPGAKSSMFNTSIGGVNPADQGSQGRSNRSGDALSILSGHSGRVLCVKTAWHGDRLLSGGADRTVRIWDLAGSAGKCLHTLTGHLGWVTQAHYWGPNTIVTGSTDRSIALWDPRVRRSPLFVLRYHHSPVSDLLVGSRTDPLMISAGGDGTIATWDFRTLSGSNAKEAAPMDETSSANKTFESKEQHVMAIRTPIATMTHAAESKRVCQSAAVMLSRGVTQPNTVLSTGVDAIVREWEISTGKLVAQDSTKHCDGISGFTTFSDMQSSLSASSAETGGEGISKYGGIITSSWDGTVRMRKFVRK